MLVCLVQHVGAAGYYTEAHELHHRKMRMKNAYYPGILATFFLKCYRNMRPDTLPDSVRIEFEEREVEMESVPGGIATKLCIDIWDFYRLPEFWGIPVGYGASRLPPPLKIMQGNGFGLFKTGAWFLAKTCTRERLIRDNTGPGNKVTFFAYKLTPRSQFADFLKFKCWSRETTLGHLHYKAVIAVLPQPLYFVGNTSYTSVKRVSRAVQSARSNRNAPDDLDRLCRRLVNAFTSNGVGASESWYSNKLGRSFTIAYKRPRL